MKLLLETKVATNYQKVFQRFDLSLFEALKPPLVDLTVERFDGCKKGDEVHLLIQLGPVKSQWISLITEDGHDETEAYFIDEGTLLPKPLKSWRHRHRIIKQDENHSLIVDDIEYSTGNQALDYLIYPTLYAQFAFRKPIYRDVFGRAD